jgi:hypothetical protein
MGIRPAAHPAHCALDGVSHQQLVDNGHNHFEDRAGEVPEARLPGCRQAGKLARQPAERSLRNLLNRAENVCR